MLVLSALVGEALGEEPTPETEADPYPLRNCVILECPLEDEIETIFVGDREIRVCCEQCVGTFNDSQDSWIEVVDEQLIAQQAPFYPLQRCVVDGKPLGDFSAIDFLRNNRLFRCCSQECCQAIEQQPTKYFDLLNKAVVKQQKPEYPLATCVVSEERLGENAIDYVVGNQLVRLADSDQIEAFDENPGKYLEQLRESSPNGPSAP